MSAHRTFDQHVALYAAYSDRVARLSEASWHRLSLRCAELSSPAFRSLLNRAFLAAAAYEPWLPDGVPGCQLIAGVSRFVQRTIAVASEVAAEFETQEARASDPPARRIQSTGNPTTDAYVDASLLVESVLARQRTDPGVATAVRAAGQAVLRHDWLTRGL